MQIDLWDLEIVVLSKKKDWILYKYNKFLL